VAFAVRGLGLPEAMLPVCHAVAGARGGIPPLGTVTGALRVNCSIGSRFNLSDPTLISMPCSRWTSVCKITTSHHNWIQGAVTRHTVFDSCMPARGAGVQVVALPEVPCGAEGHRLPLTFKLAMVLDTPTFQATALLISIIQAQRSSQCVSARCDIGFQNTQS
jgi:hypothetical protein